MEPAGAWKSRPRFRPEHGKESALPLNGIINQLTTLNAALDAFCKTAAIEHGTDEFDEARYLILSLYRNGATTAKALKTALESRLLREIERPSVWNGLSGNDR